MKVHSANVNLPSPAYFADFASPYSHEIGNLLRQLAQRHAPDDILAFVESFYKGLSTQEGNAPILARLSPEEFDHLKSGQEQHLHLLLDPEITPEDHYERACHLGWIHEMVGVRLTSLLETYHLYHRKFDHLLDAVQLEFSQREQLRVALHQRLQLDVEAQIASHVRFDEAIVSLLANLDEAIQRDGNLSDLLRSALQVVGNFDGILACLFSRPDAHGVMQIECEAGHQGLAYAEVLRAHRSPLFETSAGSDAGVGPAGRAWRSAQIQINDSFQNEDSIHPWRAEALRRGFRSSAAIPLLDDSGQSFAILSLYSAWPGFFSAPSRTAMLRHIQLALSNAVLHREQTTVVSADAGRIYRQYLEDGHVQMVYQPVIDLRSGKTESIEALARLRASDGSLVSPALFLPAFGSAGLLRLFQLGLEHVCRHFTAWRDKNPAFDLSVSLNLPADGLIQDSYRDCVFETLARWKLSPSILILEMLETRESLDISRRDERIAEFQTAGIRIAQDDLGSGHSSLLRMDRVPADRVKIDQGLVRGALKRPVRALEFIHHLTLLAQGFGAPVTVEGLEDAGLIEAAAILGADCGQGYGIARPMPAEELNPWLETWTYPIQPANPRTALGALAGYLLWDYKLATLTDWPELAANFIKEPWLVHKYLEHAHCSDPELPAMLERTQILALHGQRSAKYKQMRKELIERLGEIWLHERS